MITVSALRRMLEPLDDDLPVQIDGRIRFYIRLDLQEGSEFRIVFGQTQEKKMIELHVPGRLP